MKFIFLLDRYFIIPNLVMQMFRKFGLFMFIQVALMVLCTVVGIVGRDLDVDCKGLAKVIVCE